MGGHFLRIEPEPHGETLFAGDPYPRDALDRLQAVLDLGFGEPRQFEGRVPRAVQAEPNDGERVGVLLGNDRFFDVVGQTAAHARDAVADVLRAQVDVAREIELDGDVADLLAALAGEGLDPFDVVDLFLQPLGNLGFDDGRVRAGINGRHADDRRIDVRQLAHRQARQSDEAEENEREAHHRGEDRTLDAEARQGHRIYSSDAAPSPFSSFCGAGSAAATFTIAPGPTF